MAFIDWFCSSNTVVLPYKAAFLYGINYTLIMDKYFKIEVPLLGIAVQEKWKDVTESRIRVPNLSI